MDNLAKLGVEFRLNSVIGQTQTIDELMNDEGFDAVYVGVGAGLPRFLGVPGENLIGIYSANEYLTRSNLMKAYRFPEYDTPIVRGKNVAVFGAGNVAMDSARTALRMGAEKVRIVYRRSQEEMPARAEEIHHGKDEGIEFHLLTMPTQFFGDENGRVRGMECLQCELGEPDESGRCRPESIDNSEFTMECDLVIVAVGSGANPVLTRGTPDLALNKWGYIEADPDTGKTKKKRRLGRRRYRHRRGHGHPGHGRGTPGRRFHPQLPDLGLVRQKRGTRGTLFAKGFPGTPPKTSKGCTKLRLVQPFHFVVLVDQRGHVAAPGA